jgi:hypothetical protein
MESHANDRASALSRGARALREAADRGAGGRGRARAGRRRLVGGADRLARGRVDASFAGLVVGENSGAQPLPDGVAEKPWSEIVQACPRRSKRGSACSRRPTSGATTCCGARRAPRSSTRRWPGSTRARRSHAITHPALGTITLRQFGDWATAHTIRHNAQAQRVRCAFGAHR